MKGGDFSQQEHTVLVNNGFTEDQIQQLQDLNIDFERIIERIDEIMNQSELGFSGNSDNITQQVINSFLQPNNVNANIDLEEAIPQNPEDIHELDMTLDDNMFDNGPMNINELDVSSVSGHTTDEESDLFGGRTNKSKTNKRRSNKRRSNKRRSNKRRNNKTRSNKRKTNKSYKK